MRTDALSVKGMFLIFFVLFYLIGFIVDKNKSYTHHLNVMNLMRKFILLTILTLVLF